MSRRIPYEPAPAEPLFPFFAFSLRTSRLRGEIPGGFFAAMLYRGATYGATRVSKPIIAPPSTRAAKSPQGLQDDRDNDRLHPIQNAGAFRQRAIADVDRSDNRDEKRRRQDKAAPCHQESRPSALPDSDMNRHLGGVWPGNQVGRTEQVEKLLTREPRATPDDFILHHGDVRRRAAEGGGAQFEKEERQLSERNPRSCRT